MKTVVAVAPAPQTIAREAEADAATCRDCGKPLTTAQLKWGTGVCDECFDKRKRHPVGGPQSKCQTKAEAEAWATRWVESYTPKAHAPDLYFAPRRLYELLEPLPDGTPPPVRLLKGSWVLPVSAVRSASQIRPSWLPPNTTTGRGA